VEVAGIIAAVLLVPLLTGGVGGALVAPGDGYRQTAAVAGFAALLVIVAVLFVGFAATPERQCVKESCDNGYAIGAIFMYPPAFGLAFVGAWVGRRLNRRRHDVRSPGLAADKRPRDSRGA
jgi:hypothetical protein